MRKNLREKLGLLWAYKYNVLQNTVHLSRKNIKMQEKS
ncbi:hypothetical protein QFZ80_005848 [Paenibacillus sp. V4I7]|nr:hypothetical protein [Paenibacillus sp. V4I7]